MDFDEIANLIYETAARSYNESALTAGDFEELLDFAQNLRNGDIGWVASAG